MVKNPEMVESIYTDSDATLSGFEVFWMVDPRLTLRVNLGLNDLIPLGCQFE
jgi:hypothetical protein